MSGPRRTVSKLLADTYSRLCASEGGFIQDCIFDAWKNTKSAEAVICEAFVSLERAARRITGNRRMTFHTIETADRSFLPSLFRAAISQSEKRGPKPQI